MTDETKLTQSLRFSPLPHAHIIYQSYYGFGDSFTLQSLLKESWDSALNPTAILSAVLFYPMNILTVRLLTESIHIKIGIFFMIRRC